MVYVEQNEVLLGKLLKIMQTFPFSDVMVKEVEALDLAVIKETYYPYVEEDIVANAIHWSAGTVEALLLKKPVRTMDEVVSFAEYVLQKGKVCGE